MSDTIEKVSIIISKGSLEGVYPGLIMANGARMEGIDANLFFTFFGMDAINRKRHEHIKAADRRQPRPAPRDLARRPARDERDRHAPARRRRWRSSTSRRSRSSSR